MLDRLNHISARRIVNRIAAILIAAALTAPSLAQPSDAPRAGLAGELPPQHSTVAEQSDYILNVINAISVFFFVLIVILMVYFAIKYRRKDPNQKALSQTSHSTSIELAWSIGPLFIVIWIFWIGFSHYITLTTPPDNPYTINVTASKWAWNFTYPNGVQTENLEVPAGEPVRLLMHSNDVLHSLYIPGFRVKKDVVPGRFSQLWFEATEPTAYVNEQLPENATPEQKKELEDRIAIAGHWLFCTEFCGTQHSTMVRRVIVHEPGWRPSQRTFDSPEEHGEFLFKIKTCNTCHQIDPAGSQLAGPNFYTGIYGTEEALNNGTSVLVDDAYIHESIRNPTAKIVNGFQPAMPIFPPTQVSEEEIEALIAYIKTFGDASQDSQDNQATPATQN